MNATNLSEAATQPRGKAGTRQIEGACVGLASACAVHILEAGAGR